MTIVVESANRRTTPRGHALDPIFEGLCFAAATTMLVSLGGVLVSLLIGGWPAFAHFGFGFFTTVTWDPVREVYGAAGPIVGTLITATLALILALPVAGAVAFFLVELCPAPLRRPIGTAVELLAGIPSIVYGMWGLFVFAPFFSQFVEVPLMSVAPPGSLLEALFQGVPNGSGILAASIILAIMILPFMAATLRELLMTVPPQVRESAYGLGATMQEVVTKVTLPYIRRGAIGAVMLGLGRALGETMAVTFIIGNSHDFPNSLFASGSTIASTIANEFAEASPSQSAALIALGLVLFLITFAVLALGAPVAAQSNEQLMAISATRVAARKISNTIFTIACVGLTGVALFFLAAILWSLVSQGIGGVNLSVFTQDIPTAGSTGGGLRNAIVGSVLMGIEAMAIAIFIGVFAGTWLSEYAGQSRYGAIIRFLNDVLLSAPSILIGLFVWEVFVHHVVGHFSGFAGGVALALLASPVITRTTEDVLRLQPISLRESGVALGTPVWTVTRSILWRAAGSGMLTGILLAFARISGETAPLLFTALGNLNFSVDMMQPMANLPKVIFDFALSADDNWRRLAWVGSLLIAATVLGVTIIARAFAKEPTRS